MLNPTQRLARDFARLYECKGKEATTRVLGEALKKKEILPHEFSFKALAEECVEGGREWVAGMDPRSEGGLQEASQAVDSSAFSNITGQIVYSAIMDAYDQVPNTISSAIPVMPTRLSGEKIPGISLLADNAEIVDEGEAYPTYGLSEDYIETPQTVKRGFIVPVTKEAIFFDRTNLVLQRASDVGTSMRTNKEKRAIDCLIDSDTGVVNRVVADHRHKWKGTSYASFQATTPWVNIKTSNTLTDWTDIDNDNQLWANMTDPYTGEPIQINARTIIVCPETEMVARSILTATLLQLGNAASTAPVMFGPNLVSGYSLLSSAQLKARLSADSQATTHWYIADLAKAFVYMENWPITLSQQGAGSEDEFNRDIVVKFKASERGAYFVKNPRYVIKNTVA